MNFEGKIKFRYIFQIYIVLNTIFLIGNILNSHIIPSMISYLISFVSIYYLLNYILELSKIQVFTLSITLLFSTVIIFGLLFLAFTGSLYFSHLETVLLTVSLVLFTVLLWFEIKYSHNRIFEINRLSIVDDIKHNREYQIISLINILVILIFLFEISDPIYLPSTFGLWDKLSILYYLGLIGIILISVFSITNKHPKWILVAETLTFLLYTHFLSISITRSYTIHTSMQFFGHLQYIFDHNALSPIELRERLWYHAWPGFFILNGLFVYEFDFSTQLLILAWWPIFFRFLSTIYIYQFSSIFSSEESKIDYPFLYLFIYLLTDWLYQDYFAPQSLGFLFMIQILILILSIDLSNYMTKRNMMLSIFIIYIYTGLFRTHLLTSLFTIALLGVYIVSQLIFKLSNGQFNKNKLVEFYQTYKLRIISSFILILSILIILLYIFLTSWWFQNKGLRFISYIFDFDLRALNRLLDSIGGVQERVITVLLRVILSGIVGILWGSSILYFIRLRNRLHQQDHKMLEINVITLFVVSVFTGFLIFIYSDELFHRMYLYSLPVMVLGISKLIEQIKNHRRRLTLIVVLLVILSMLFLPAKYGNERVNIIYEGELEAAQYINQNYNGTPVISYQQMMASSFCYECHDVYELRRPDRPQYARWDGNMQQYVHITENEDIEISSSFNTSHLIFLTKSYKLKSQQFDLNNEVLYSTILGHVSNSPYYNLVYQYDGTVVFQFEQ